MQMLSLHADARDRARSDLLERRLKRFQPRFQTRVRALAERHPRLKDLALSFPALLFAIAVPRAGYDREQICARVIGGAPLRDVAALAQLPLWLRRLDPASFGGPIPVLPDGAFVSKHVVNHVPRSPKKVDAWLHAISQALVLADEAVAVWMAREWNRRPLRWRDENMRWVCLWAWYSKSVSDDPCRIKQSWSPSLSLYCARRHAYDWRQNVSLFLELGDDRVADLWFKPGAVGPFDVVSLDRYEEIVAEARAMKHCVRFHGTYIVQNASRLWSIRRDGERIATFEVCLASESPFPHIGQVKMKDDKRAPEGIWRVAQTWLDAQDRSGFSARYACWEDTPVNPRAWRRMWRPYWLAKRHAMDWLPLAPTRLVIDNL